MKKFILLLTAFFQTGLMLHAEDAAKKETDLRFDHHGLNSYIKGLNSERQLEEFTPDWSVLGEKVMKEEKITLSSDRDRAYNLIENLIEQNKLAPASSVTNPFFTEKMDVIHGGFGKLKTDAMTTAGKLHLAELLTSPTTDTTLLTKRQKLIEFLIKNEKLCQDIEKIASALKKNEKYSLSLIAKNAESDVLGKHISDMYNYSSFLKRDKFNKYSFALSAKYLAGEKIGVSGVWVPLGLVLLGLVRRSFQNSNEESYDVSQQKQNLQKAVLGIIYAIATFPAALALGDLVLKPFMPQGPYKYICHVAQEMALCMNELKDVYNYVHTHKNIFGGICDFSPLEDLAQNKASDAFSRVIAFSKMESICRGDTPHMIGKGPAIALINNVVKARNEVASVFYAFGQLEAYVAVANLYRSHQSKPAQYCFVDFVHADKPMIVMDEFWNPFINADTVVCNSIHMGGTAAGNIVVTGPNTGGKTTILKALSYNVILAQVFGIAAAKTCQMTCFDNVSCQLNVTDDLSNGVSLFKAEVLHAKALNNTVKGLKDNEFGFVIMDEAFRGTNAKEGEAISCKFAKQLAEHKNCLTITATHYPKMGEIEEFGQKHVEVIIHPDGSYTRTFKIKDGASTLNIADKILQEENIFDS